MGDEVKHNFAPASGKIERLYEEGGSVRAAFGIYGFYLKDIKKSPKPEKDYEILDVVGMMEDCSYEKIHSVKRLSDGEVFSVGDDVHNTNYPERNKGKIYKIQEAYGDIYVYYMPNRGCDLLRDIQKSRQPILKTEDGVELFEGDKHWWMDDNNMHIGEDLTDKSDPAKGYKYFSTREAAEEYRIAQARMLSVYDVAEVIYPDYTEKEVLEKLKELVKSRL